MSAFGLAGLLAGCAGERPAAPPTVRALDARAMLDRALPRSIADRPGWAADIDAGFATQALTPTYETVCAVIAVIEQESGFHVDPVVPGLPAIAWREIDTRAARAGVPRVLVHGALQLTSATGRSYGDRIDAARTEKDLSDVYEDFIGAVPLGRTLFADDNPIRTRGPMQVNVAFIKQYSAVQPYPFPVKTTVADEAFTRRGSLYFGIAHLLAYPAPYDRFLFRFADYNAGRYASRNAAFQRAVSRATGMTLAPDGALLPHAVDSRAPGSTELAVRAVAKRLGISESSAHAALEQSKSRDFERTSLYQGVFRMAEELEGHPLPRAVIPRITLHGPKISRHLTTEWYARRVDERFQKCLNR